MNKWSFKITVSELKPIEGYIRDMRQKREPWVGLLSRIRHVWHVNNIQNMRTNLLKGIFAAKFSRGGDLLVFPKKFPP